MIQKNKISQYISIPKSIIQDSSLSPKSLVLLIHLMSLPKDWDIEKKSVKSMFCKRYGESNRRKFDGFWNELQEADYLSADDRGWFLKID
ncbi:hypothetical protein [Pseudolactococcus yaeyamensis]